MSVVAPGAQRSSPPWGRPRARSQACRSAPPGRHPHQPRPRHPSDTRLPQAPATVMGVEAASFFWKPPFAYADPGRALKGLAPECERDGQLPRPQSSWGRRGQQPRHAEEPFRTPLLLKIPAAKRTGEVRRRPRAVFRDVLRVVSPSAGPEPGCTDTIRIPTPVLMIRRSAQAIRAFKRD